jgi:trehalose 6-phosphate synthase
MTERIVVVANRLPVQRVESGEWAMSPGGLVSAVAPILRETEGSWVGWTGLADDEPARFRHDGISQVAVPLSRREIDDFYLGFSNGTIWPLYHDAIRPPEFHRHWWKPYVDINRRFAERAASVLEPGDLAWIHDYQLQLVPAMLRRLRPDIRIGFFLHIPFPPVEVFARLPWRTQILEGLLGADVLAFQTRLVRHNFDRAARRFGGAEGSTRVAKVDGRSVQLKSTPISIDERHFAELAALPSPRRRVDELKAELGGRRIILGVDRLDYTKGIDVRLRAFDTLLEHHPELANDVVFVQIAVPSREGVADYAAMRDDVEGLVGRINGAHGDLHRIPVHYSYGGVPTSELVAYYQAADVMCVTPLRDGMNLVAKEFVASRSGNNGVLVLSEFAGAVHELTRALRVNPYDVDGVAETLWTALNLDRADVQNRMAHLRRRVRNRNVFDWAQACIEAVRA